MRDPCGPGDEAWCRGRAKVRRGGQGLVCVCVWGVLVLGYFIPEVLDRCLLGPSLGVRGYRGRKLLS